MPSRLKQVEEQWIPFTKIYTILDKLEQRISKLEKVLASHAKCIGEIRFGKSARYNNEQS